MSDRIAAQVAATYVKLAQGSVGIAIKYMQWRRIDLVEEAHQCAGLARVYRNAAAMNDDPELFPPADTADALMDRAVRCQSAANDLERAIEYLRKN